MGDWVVTGVRTDTPAGFGELLRQYRVAAGLSQAELAERAGLSVHGISDLERGARTRPYPTTRRRLARALELTEVASAALQASARPTGGARPDPGRRLSGGGGRLPGSLTSFVGREQDLAATHSLLAHHRLVTLVGTGGIGKTRLALQLAAETRDDYPDDVWFVDLAPLADATLVPQAVAAALGVHERPRQALTATLVGALRERRLLLVLDNCEHLLDGCARTGQLLLDGCRHLRILATSREALGLAGEAIWRVPPLPSPDPERLWGVEDLGGYAAVRLFIDRARLAWPSFEVTVRNAPSLALLCHRLDGIPLALELAAPRISALTVEQLADHLDDRFRSQVAGSRTALSRQKTLTATLDWSHDLLAADERQVFRRLAVFAGGWLLEAAEAVCADDQLRADEVLDVLERLVAKSLVQADCRSDAARYWLLEPVRRYAGARLAAAGEAPRVRDRHRDWYLALTERAEPAVFGPEQLAWLARLEAEHDNLRAATAWSLATAPEYAVRLLAAIWPFCQRRSHYAEWARWLGRARPLTEQPVPRSRAWAGILLGAAQLAFERGDRVEARVQAEASVGIARGSGDEALVARGLRELGLLLTDTGEMDRAEQVLDEALALSRAAGDQHGINLGLQFRGITVLVRNEYDRARTLLEQALGFMERFGGDRFYMAPTLAYLGRAYREQGDLERAEAVTSAGLRIARELGSTWQEGVILHYLGRVALSRIDLIRARAYGQEGLALGQAMRNDDVVAGNLDLLGRVAWAAGDTRGAIRLLEEALALRRPGGHWREIADVLRVLGLALRDAGDDTEAASRLREGLALAVSLGDRLLMVGLLEGLARTEAVHGDPARAARWLAAAAAQRRAIGAALPSIERPAHDATVSTVQAALGAAALSVAWAAGEASSLELVATEAARLARTAVACTNTERLAGFGTRAALSDRESAVAEWVARGLTNRQIAAGLTISVRTVDRHVANILDKLGLSTRAQVAAWVVARRGAWPSGTGLGSPDE